MGHKRIAEVVEIDQLVGNWAPVADWPHYMVCDTGQVYSIRRKKIMKQCKIKGDYIRLTLSDVGREKCMSVHRLVAVAFIPNPLAKITVNHKDGDKHNNHIDNLEWNTYSENSTHASAIGLLTGRNVSKGEGHCRAILSALDVSMIKWLLQNKEFTLNQIAKRFSVTKMVISKIKREITWKHLTI